MSETPLVSVVMAVYNGALHLDDAVNSIRQQTFLDFEFVIINDGSTDGTAEILRRHAAADSRLRILDQPNQGLTPSLNRGIAEARGKYIARMDADDISVSERLEKQVTFLEQHPHVALLGTAAQLFTDQGLMKQIFRHPTDSAEIKRAMMMENKFVHPTVMMRRDVVQEVGGYRLNCTEDYDLFMRMADRHDVANLDEVLLRYRKHPGQATMKRACRTELLALGVRHCAKIRGAGQPDPALATPLDGHASLLKIGVTPQEIEAALLGEPLNQSWRLIRAAQYLQAVELFAEIHQLLASQPVTDRTKTETERFGHQCLTIAENTNPREARMWLQILHRVLAGNTSVRHLRSELALFIGKTYLAERSYFRAASWMAYAYGLEPGRLGKMIKHRFA